VFPKVPLHGTKISTISITFFLRMALDTPYFIKIAIAGPIVKKRVVGSSRTNNCREIIFSYTSKIRLITLCIYNIFSDI